MFKLNTEPSSIIVDSISGESQNIEKINFRTKNHKRYSLMHNYKQKMKTQNDQEKIELLSTNKNSKDKKKINIFNSEYLQCLNYGGFKDAVETKKFGISSPKKIQNVSYIRYQSQPKIQTLNLQNNNLTTQESPQQIYKADKNYKFKKFKISLKPREQQNSSQLSQKQKLIAFKANKNPKSFLTQIKSEISNNSSTNRQSKLTYNKQTSNLLPQTINSKQNTQQSQRFMSVQVRPANSTSFKSKISKLDEKSNLNQSIKIYETKRQLLEELQTFKNYQEQYGQKYFETLMRNQFQQLQKHYSYTYKIKQELGKGMEVKPKNKFIQRLYTQRPQIRYRKNLAEQIHKLKGRRLTQVCQQ